MQRLFFTYLAAILCVGGLYASNEPVSDSAVKKQIFESLNNQFDKGLAIFKSTCYEYQTLLNEKALTEVSYCKKLIAMLDDINGKLEEGFRFKRHDIVSDSNQYALVERYRREGRWW